VKLVVNKNFGEVLSDRNVNNMMYKTKLLLMKKVNVNYKEKLKTVAEKSFLFISSLD
jgi:hypothetical protein